MIFTIEKASYEEIENLKCNTLKKISSPQDSCSPYVYELEIKDLEEFVALRDEVAQDLVLCAGHNIIIYDGNIE